MHCKHRCGRALVLTFRSSNCLPAFVSPQLSTSCLNKSEETHGRCLPGSLLTALLSDICLLSLFATRSMRTRPSRLFPSSLFWSESSHQQNPHYINFKQICQDLQIVNGYGPAETTVFSTTYPEIGEQVPQHSHWSAAGEHADLYSGCTWGAGAGGSDWGTIYRGSGVARGYLNRPELTAEQFCA